MQLMSELFACIESVYSEVCKGSKLFTHSTTLKFVNALNCFY